MEVSTSFKIAFRLATYRLSWTGIDFEQSQIDLKLMQVLHLSISHAAPTFHKSMQVRGETKQFCAHVGLCGTDYVARSQSSH